MSAQRARLWVGICLNLVVVLTISPALPRDLADDVARVEAAWVQSSSHLVRLAPIFLESGQVRAITLPPSFLSSKQPGCITVGMLGSRTIDFATRVQPNGEDDQKAAEGGVPEGRRSVAGATMVVRCGAARRELADLLIGMKSPRGAVDILIVRGPRPAKPLDTVLPERAAGPFPDPPQPTPPSPPGPIARRVAAFEQGVRGTGGTVVGRRTVTANRQGKGTMRVRIGPGCHRLALLPDTSFRGRVRPADVDVELRNAQSGTLVASDRSFGADGLVETCVGEATAFELGWSGAMPRGPVFFLHAAWEISPGNPPHWSPQAQAAVASAFWRRHMLGPAHAPVWNGIGVSGKTQIPVELEPGACYVFGAGVEQGEVRVIRVTADLGAHQHKDTGGGGLEGSLVAFCASQRSFVVLDVAAFGSNLVWVGALWRVSQMTLGTEGS